MQWITERLLENNCKLGGGINYQHTKQIPNLLNSGTLFNERASEPDCVMIETDRVFYLIIIWAAVTHTHTRMTAVIYIR